MGTNKQSLSETKTIDATCLDDENPHFGAPFFEMNNGTYAYRRVFRYDAQTIMNLFMMLAKTVLYSTIFRP